MIDPSFFCKELEKIGVGFYAGVPDSLLKSLCAYISDNIPDDKNIIAANEGCAIGLAAGYHLATGKIPVVYMQNSGMGNSINPLLSLVDEDVYNMPVILIIGWRGMPGVHDEPQHVKQGKVTCTLLETMGIPYDVVPFDEEECIKTFEKCADHLKNKGSPYTLVVRKDTFSEYKMTRDDEPYPLSRECAIEVIAKNAGDALIVSTTGMASRELYEIRDRNKESHASDFLTVGSMGHASQIALGIALNLPERKVICIDGDGAAIMHLGGMSTIGSRSPYNYIHVVIDNGAHDSVGGQPTVSRDIDLGMVAEAMGYANIFTVQDANGLEKALECTEGPVFIRVMTHRGARKDLGRPKSTPRENKEAFMENAGSI